MNSAKSREQELPFMNLQTNHNQTLIGLQFSEKMFLLVKYTHMTYFLMDFWSSLHLQSKSMDWFLYDNGLRHERVNSISYSVCVRRAVNIKWFIKRNVFEFFKYHIVNIFSSGHVYFETQIVWYIESRTRLYIYIYG